ncbi:MAG: hypothetical protein HY556_03895 [Euryarchaeota archaeon]|nr:hypothetical protein [Euryarchaeota archaeon]
MIIVIAVSASATVTAEGGTQFKQVYQVRASLGDIPTTVESEAGGYWNVQESLAVDLADSTHYERTFSVPPGEEFVTLTCRCEPGEEANVTIHEANHTISFDRSGANATRTIVFEHRRQVAAGGVFGFLLGAVPEEGRKNALILLFLPESYDLQAPVSRDFVLPTTSENPGMLIHGYSGTETSALPATLYFVAAPRALDPAPVVRQDAAASDATSPGPSISKDPLLLGGAIVGGVIVGALGWRLFGPVLAGGRRQVVFRGRGAPSTREALEVRRLALVAALRELGEAHDAGLEAEAMDLAAELRKEALHVMEELERIDPVPEG